MAFDICMCKGCTLKPTLIKPFDVLVDKIAESDATYVIQQGYLASKEHGPIIIVDSSYTPKKIDYAPIYLRNYNLGVYILQNRAIVAEIYRFTKYLCKKQIQESSKLANKYLEKMFNKIKKIITNIEIDCHEIFYRIFDDGSIHRYKLQDDKLSLNITIIHNVKLEKCLELKTLEWPFETVKNNNKVFYIDTSSLSIAYMLIFSLSTYITMKEIVENLKKFRLI